MNIFWRQHFCYFFSSCNCFLTWKKKKKMSNQPHVQAATKLRVRDYTLLATLGLTTCYGKINMQLENNHNNIPACMGTADAQYLLLSSPVNNSKRIRSSIQPERVPRHQKRKSSDIVSPEPTINGDNDNDNDNDNGNDNDVVANQKLLSGKKQRKKNRGGSQKRIRSAFARVATTAAATATADTTKGKCDIKNGGGGGNRLVLPGERNSKANTNANNPNNIADNRPREYGQVWFNRYLILAKLGEGAFSQAFLAADMHCNRMGKRHDGTRLVTIKRMGVKEAAIGVSDYQTISLLNSLDTKQRVPIVCIYDIFLHCPPQVSRQPTGAAPKNNQKYLAAAYEEEYEVAPANSSSSMAPHLNGNDDLTQGYHVCLVMEPLLGSTLEEAFPRRVKALYLAHDDIVAQQMHMDMIRSVIRQLLLSIAHMHTHSLIHADIKTTNVMCVNDSSMQVKLIDFGNAVTDTDVSEYYKTFEIQTVWFRAPEVAYQRPFGRAIDMWSIGCVMCELWLGRSLFTDMDNQSLISSMLRLRGPPPARLYSGSPLYADMVRYWNKKRPSSVTNGGGGRVFTPVTPTNRTYQHHSMEQQKSIDWEPQLRIQWLKHSLQADDDEFASLADALLEYDPEERLTASEALEHPFFQGAYPL